MTSPAISSTASAAPTAAAKQTKAAGKGSANPLFNQVLSQEMAQRNADAPALNDAGVKPLAGTRQTEKSDATDKTEKTDKTDDASAKPADASSLLALVATLSGKEATAAGAATGEQEADKVDATAMEAAGGKGKGKGRDTLDISAPADGRDQAGKTKASDAPIAAADMRAEATDARALQDRSGKAGIDDSSFAQAMDRIAADQDATQTAPATIAPLQQAAAPLASAATGVPVDRLTPPVGTQAWDQALGQKVVWMVGNAQQSATLSLNPPDLGPMQIVLNVTSTHASATFVSAQPEVRQALEAAMPKLHQMMSDAGIQLSQASVNAGSPQQQNFAEQQARQQASGGTGTTQADGAAAVTTRVQTIRSGTGLVDTFA